MKIDDVRRTAYEDYNERPCGGRAQTKQRK